MLTSLAEPEGGQERLIVPFCACGALFSVTECLHHKSLLFFIHCSRSWRISEMALI